MLSHPILTRSEAKEALEIRDNDTSKDAHVDRLIASATHMIEKMTGRYLTKQVHTEYFTARTNSRVDYDLTSSTTPNILDDGLRRDVKPQTLFLTGTVIDPDADLNIWYDPSNFGTDAFSEATRLVAERDYQVDYDNDKVSLNIASVYRMRAIKAVYTAGYAFAEADDQTTISAEAPDWLKMAALVQIQFLHMKLRRDNVGMKNERQVSGKDSIAQSAFAALGGLTPEAQSFVAHLKRVRTGRA